MSNAVDQYLNLYGDYREAIGSHSAGVLNARRDDGAEALARAGRFHVRGDEGYEKTSVDEMFSPDFGVNVNRVNMPVDRKSVV